MLFPDSLLKKKMLLAVIYFVFEFLSIFPKFIFLGFHQFLVIAFLIIAMDDLINFLLIIFLTLSQVLIIKNF